MSQAINVIPDSIDDVINKVNAVTPQVATKLNPKQLIQHWLNVISLEAHLYPHDKAYVESYHQLLNVLVQCNLLPLACRVQRDVGGNYLTNEKILQLTEEAKQPDFVIKNTAPIRLFQKPKTR